MSIGANRFTKAAYSSAADMAAIKAGIQAGTYIYGGTSGGSANAQTISLAPAITAYTTGMGLIRFKAGFSNTTTTPTLNINALGAKTMVRNDGTALAVGDIIANQYYNVYYDGTNIRIICDLTNFYGATTTGSANAQAATSSGFLSYRAGDEIVAIAGYTNTGALTLNVNALGAKAVTDIVGNALIGGEVYAGAPFRAIYDGTQFRLMNPAFVGCRVYNSANISIANATETALTFNSETYDTAGMHSTSSNTSRLIAPVPGRYAWGFNCLFASNAVGIRWARCIQNPTTAVRGYDKPATNLGDDTRIFIAGEDDFAINDYIELYVYQTSGGALNILNSGSASPIGWMRKVG